VTTTSGRPQHRVQRHLQGTKIDHTADTVINQIMDEAEVSQHALADHLGLFPSNVSMICNRKRKALPGRWRAIAHALGCKPEDIADPDGYAKLA
jgi:DNA-binding transcriptional regulator YdaS (Cro superfamily)